MSQLIIANVAAPFVLSQTGSILLFVSIIPVEMLVVFLCLKLLGIAISFFRLFEVVLAANIATTMLGIFLLSGPSSASIEVIGLSLLIGFMFSFSIEAVIYGRFFARENFELSRCQIILFSLLSNLASYIIFVSALTSLNYDNAGSPFLTPNPQRVVRVLRTEVIPAYITIQTNFYRDKKRFIYNREELNEISNISEEENKHFFANKLILDENTKKDSLLYQVYLLDIQGDKTAANLTVTSKRKDLTSYRLTIFIVKDKDNYQFIQGICETDKPSMTAPEIPQLVNGEFQCPPGSSDKSDEFRLPYGSIIDL
jgi:Type IV pilin-like G and H, putative